MGGIGLLGPFHVDDGVVLEPRDRIALSVLALRRGGVVSPDQFAEALWGDALPASWHKQVHICVGRLRKAIGASAIETVPGGYRLAPGGVDVDLDHFEELIERGRALMASGEADRAAVAFARARSLWRGTPLDDLDGWLPGRSEAARLEELRRTADEDWLEARLAAGEHREVAAEAEALVTAEPLRERRWAALALAQYRCGRQADALRSLSQARHALLEQSGIDLGPDLVALERAILSQEPSLAVPPPTVTSEECPYKGLAFYDVDDSESFCGRQSEIEECVARLRAMSLLVLAGPSGCGKSSLARAGLVPVLQRLGHDVVVIVPGHDPMAALIDAAVSAGDRPALVIDQFEELFTLGSPPNVVDEFCRRVAEFALDRAVVVIAVRSDHLGGLSVDPTLSRLAEQGLHLVNPLAGDALREAIEQPAARAGLRLEAGLVDVLVRECDGEPGALPLLSHALVETWRRRDGPVLTVEGYRASGGIRVAVARSADRLYDSLRPDQRSTLRAVLLRLVTPSPEGDPVRCRVPSRSLLDDPGRERVVALLVRSRLVTLEADSFELAHEALARAWPRLQSWLDEDADGLRVLRHLTTAAEEWESLGRPDSELYRGARLEAALEWRDATQPDLTAVESAFLDVSAAQAAGESRVVAERAQRDARQNRWLRSLLIAVAVLLAGSVIAGALALISRQEVRRQRDTAQAAQDRAERQGDAAQAARERAEQERRVAVARELAAAATANLSVDAERSVLLALAAVGQTRNADGSVLPEAEDALHRALTTNRIVDRVTGVGGALDWSPDGTTFVTEGPTDSGIVDIRDARSGESVRSFHGHDGDIRDVAFNADGTLMATTASDGTARVWDPATGEELHVITGPSGQGAWGPSFSADGRLFAAAWPEDGAGVVRILDLGSGELVQSVASVPGAVSTSFAPDGTRVVVASGAEPLAAVLDVASGTQVLTLTGHLASLNEAVWSPDGTRIATAANDGSARLFDAVTGRQQFALLGHVSRVPVVDWSPDSTRLVTGGGDGAAKLWLLIEGDGRELASLSAYDTRSTIAGVAFSPDGTRVLTGDRGITSTIIWDVGVSAGAEVANLPAAGFIPGDAEFTGDGSRLVATAGRGTLGVWDPSTWTSVARIGGGLDRVPADVSDVSIGTAVDVERVVAEPTGRLVAIVRNGGGGVEVWDTETAQQTFVVDTEAGHPWAAWSPDGEVLAVSDGGRARLTIFDRSGRQVTHVNFADAWVGYVAFTADGDHVVTTLEPNRVVLWNWRTGTVDRSVNTSAHKAVASPTGDLVAVAPHESTDTRAIEIWDTSDDRLVTTLIGQTGEVSDITFSPDGSRVATSSADGTVRFWDPRTGDQTLLLRGPGATSAISFNPDGSQLASYGADGVVRVWALDIDQLAELGRERVTRDFTDDECRQYLHAERCVLGPPATTND